MINKAMTMAYKICRKALDIQHRESEFLPRHHFSSSLATALTVLVL